MIVYEVTLEQPILLPGRTKPDMIERVFKVRANSKQAASNAVTRAGHKGNVTNVKPIIVSVFEYPH